MATRRNLLLIGGLVGLIALVALAARGHSPTGGSSHGVSSNLVWEFVLLGFVSLFIITLPVALWAFFSMRAELMTHERNQRRTLKRRAIFLFALVVLAGVSFWRYRAVHHAAQKPHVKRPGSAAGVPGGHHDKAHIVPFDWLPAIVVFSIAGVAALAVAYLLWRKSYKRPPTRAEIVAELSSVLDESLDDLRAERDPRKAVIATYARMERTLGGFGFPRAVAETPLEYLGRILRDLLHTSAEAVAKLTALFERAKFSPHEIDPGMKNDAIDALVTVRDELRAAVP